MYWLNYLLLSNIIFKTLESTLYANIRFNMLDIFFSLCMCFIPLLVKVISQAEHILYISWERCGQVQGDAHSFCSQLCTGYIISFQLYQISVSSPLGTSKLNIWCDIVSYFIKLKFNNFNLQFFYRIYFNFIVFN